MEGGVDVEAGVEKQEMFSVLDELKGYGCGELEGVALTGFEIKDVVCPFGQLESIRPEAALERVVALSSAESVAVAVPGGLR